MGCRSLFLLLFLIPCLALASKADEAAIRKQLKERAAAFVRGDAKRLATTELPTFHAVTFDGKPISSTQIRQHVAWRFKSQTQSKREERPLSFKFSKNLAEVKLTIFDDYVTKDAQGVLTRAVRREHAIATWTKTASGWKQAKLQFTRVEWVDEKGKWQSRP